MKMYPKPETETNQDDTTSDTVSQVDTSTLDEVEIASDHQSDGPIECFDDFTKTPLLVYLEDVSYQYSSSVPLISNLNVHIPAGQIYGLLGPSGCGKSTTLKLILGLIKPQKGRVRVFGERPGTYKCPIPGRGCGYMPQDLAMMPQMTIGDHFNYYGRLNGMDERDIMKQANYLLDFLQIPATDRPVEKLSGGQQRRASLALALLHSPPLLVLDEPTVGIDPLLRNKVWSYLREMAINHGKTILITTHYIEEARNADTIALMRFGRLLTEVNPERLLSSFGMDTIEDVFLNLCESEDKIGESDAREQTMKIVTDPSKRSSRIFVPYTPDPTMAPQSFSFDFCRTKAMILDAFTYSKLCFITVFGASLLPTLQVFLFHYSVGKPLLNLPVAVSVNQSSNDLFTGPFIDFMKNRSVDIKLFNTGAEAVQEAMDGYAFAALDFPMNFSKCLLNRARRGAETNDWNLDCGKMRFSPDNTFQFIVFQVGLVMRDAFNHAINIFYPRHKYHPDSINVPIVTKELIYGKEEFDYQSFMTPGMYMALIYLAPMVVSIFMLLEQKTQGHVERSQAAGVKPIEIVSAHYIVEIIILLIQNTLMLSTSLYYFDAQNLGSTTLLFLITTAVGMAGISTALSWAIVLQTKLAALIFIYGITISLWMICGIFWPTEMIEWAVFRWAVPFLPLTLPTETARNIMNRGWGIDHTKVWLGFIVAAAYIILPILLSIRRLK